MDVTGNKKRKLNYDKCTFCRKDKKKCDPPNRVWPQKCNRCEKNKLECSENENLKVTGSATVRCQELEIELSWLRRCGDHAALLKLMSKPMHSPWKAIIEEFESKIKARTEKILYQLSQLLHCPSPLARQPEFSSVVSNMIYWRSTVEGESKVFQSEKELGALMESSKASDRTDIELCLKECILHSMDARANFPTLIIGDLKDYTSICKRYMERIRLLEHVRADDYLNPNNFSFPFNGDTRILGLLMRYTPEVLFEARDILGCNALTASILIADQKDIEQLVSAMDITKLLSLAKDAGTHGLTILHVAAMRSLNCVFGKIIESDNQELKSLIDLPDMYGATPLLYASMNGSYTTMRNLLRLGAKPQTMDQDTRTALHHVARKEEEDNARQLVHQGQALCASQYIMEDVPDELARECANLIKRFFQQPYKGLFETDNCGSIWLRLLHSVSKSSHLQLIELLRINSAVSWINQRDKQGRTAISLAAQAGNLGAVIILLIHGADVNIADHDNKIPWHYARERRDADMISALHASLSPAVI